MAGEFINVGRAAQLVGRHPETIRRWVWSGRLGAERRGRQLLVSASEVRSLAGVEAAQGSLRDWVDRARAWRAESAPVKAGRSAADLVIEDRARRSGGEPAHAGR